MAIVRIHDVSVYLYTSRGSGYRKSRRILSPAAVSMFREFMVSCGRLRRSGAPVKIATVESCKRQPDTAVKQDN